MWLYTLEIFLSRCEKKIHFTYHINLFENTLLSSYKKTSSLFKGGVTASAFSEFSTNIYILDSAGSLYVHMTGTSSMIVCIRKLHARISLYFLISINYVFKQSKSCTFLEWWGVCREWGSLCYISHSLQWINSAGVCKDN